MYTKANLAALRVKKDIAELSQHRLNATHASTSIDFPDGTRNLLKLKVGVSMTAGLYEGATFYFMLTIPPSYPFHAPTVACTSRAWHPNIDLHTGLVSLPILTKDWRPVLSINTVVFALQLMFIEPTEHYPVNEAAASALKSSPDVFREQVLRSLEGGFFFGVHFESHRHGTGGRGKAGGPGATQKRKRVCGESMDTDEVQSTLEAMRIQGDDRAGQEVSSQAWDKRPRHEQQRQHQHQRYEAAPVPPLEGLRYLAAGGVVGGQQQQQPHQRPVHAVGSDIHHHLQNPHHQGGGGVGGGAMALDRSRCHVVEEASRSAAATAAVTAAAAAAASAATPVGLRCGVGSSGSSGSGGVGVVCQPVDGDGVGTAAAWGGGQYQVQAVAMSRLH